MDPTEQQIKDVLQLLVGNRTCDYAPVEGGVLIIEDESQQKMTGVKIDTFLALRAQGLIIEKGKQYNWHPVFRPSFQNPIVLYELSPKGGLYLEQLQRS